MFKKFLMGVAGFIAATGFALAAVEVNTADQAQLESIKGIGPSTAKKIIDERKKGDFKDWQDLSTRVNGVGDANSMKFSQAGLTVNGQANAGVPTKNQTKKGAMNKGKPATDAVKSDAAKTDAKMDDVKADVKGDTTTAKDKSNVKANEVKSDVKSGAGTPGAMAK